MARKVGDKVVQKTIEVQQLITVATVREDPNGFGDPMVVEAFRQAGMFLHEKGGAGEAADVQFHYLGVMFRASCGPDEEDR